VSIGLAMFAKPLVLLAWAWVDDRYSITAKAKKKRDAGSGSTALVVLDKIP